MMMMMIMMINYTKLKFQLAVDMFAIYEQDMKWPFVRWFCLVAFSYFFEPRLYMRYVT